MRDKEVRFCGKQNERGKLRMCVEKYPSEWNGDSHFLRHMSKRNIRDEKQRTIGNKCEKKKRNRVRRRRRKKNVNDMLFWIKRILMSWRQSVYVFFEMCSQV